MSIYIFSLIEFCQLLTRYMIVPDQKVTAGALNEVVKSLWMFLGTEGGCVPTGAPTLKSVEIRV